MFGLLLTPLTTNVFAAATCAKSLFLGLVPWYYYLDVTRDAQGRCAVNSFSPSGGNQSAVFGAHSPFLLIALAVVDDLIRVAAFVAVSYVIVGGIQYTTSQGAPDATKKAQSTIINALIGLAIALISAAIVGFVGHKLGSS